jgi:hypothetical protein
MAEITLVRQELVQLTEQERSILYRALFGMVDGWGEVNRRRWRGFWKRLVKLEPGECVVIKSNQPRSGPYHRRHFKLEHDLFEAQERFELADQFLYWLKVGAGWVTWAAGPTGGVVPIPRSVSYAEADQAEFEEFHGRVVQFLRGPHAAPYLWPHLKKTGKCHEMMHTILTGFNE